MLVLHPRHKLEYFKTAAWEDDWIETAEGLVRDEFERSYSARHVSDEEGDGMDVDDVTAAPVRFVIICFFNTELMVLLMIRRNRRVISSTTSLH